MSLPPVPLDRLALWRSGAGRAEFVVASMFTRDYAEKAGRLRRSCEKFGLAYAMYEVPSVHRSISRHGLEDSPYSKPRFVSSVLREVGAPVLYMDADTEFCAPPVLIGELLRSGTEFAIYNWAAEERTEAYVPAPVVLRTEAGTEQPEHRFFRFGSSFDLYDPRQLLAAGAVQLYADTPPAARLLAQWQRALEAFPGSADDHCMDFTFNNRGPELGGLRFAWLPKEYARYAWWIYARPVIDHPEFANIATHFRPVQPPDGRRQFYVERAEQRRPEPLFPPDCIIDTLERRLLRIRNKAIVSNEPFERELWVSRR